MLRYLGISFIISILYSPVAMAATAPDFCEAIKNHANQGTLEKQLTDKVSNIKIGQQNVNLEAKEEGTAHVPSVYAYDAATGNMLDIDFLHQKDGGDYWGGDYLRFITLNNITQILYYRDVQHPIATFPVNGGKACKFRTHFEEIAAPDAIEPELCNQLIQGDNLPSILFTAKASSHIDLETYNWLASDNQTGNISRLDIANNGTPRNIVEIKISSSAGSGCSQIFYDLLDETGNHLASDDIRTQLMALQNVNLQDVYPIRAETGYATCQNAPRLFRYQNNMYFENKPAQWPPIDKGNSYHRVARLDNGKAIDVCNFSFRTRVEVQ